MSDRKENAKTPAGAPVMKAASSLVRRYRADQIGRHFRPFDRLHGGSVEVFVLHARHACAWRSRLDRPCGHDVGGPPNATNDTAVPIPTEAIYRAQHLNLF
jgi:hypothetical protein